MDRFGHIAQDLGCIECGNNLRGVDVEEDACPHCGADLEPSLESDELHLSPAAWLRRLADGTLLIMAGLVALAMQWGIALAVGLFVDDDAPRWLLWLGLAWWALGTVLATATAALGAWWTAAPEPHAGRTSAARPLARAVIGAGLVAAWLPLATLWLGAAGPVTLALWLTGPAIVAANVAGPFFLLTWLATLARRSGADKLVADTWKLGWVVATWWVLVGVGLLLAAALAAAREEATEIERGVLANCVALPPLVGLVILTAIVLAWSLKLLYEYRELLLAAEAEGRKRRRPM